MIFIFSIRVFHLNCASNEEAEAWCQDINTNRSLIYNCSFLSCQSISLNLLPASWYLKSWHFISLKPATPLLLSLIIFFPFGFRFCLLQLALCNLVSFFSERGCYLLAWSHLHLFTKKSFGMIFKICLARLFFCVGKKSKLLDKLLLPFGFVRILSWKRFFTIWEHFHILYVIAKNYNYFVLLSLLNVFTGCSWE